MATLDSLYDCSESWSLGSGANGSVYTAVQLATGTTVALKLMPADDGLAPDELDGWVDYMLDLVSLQAGLDHPNIAPILDIFTDRSTGAVLTAMPLYSGGSAAHFLQRHEHLGERHIARIVRSVCLAVHYCHINGVVHRDIKLENVLLDAKGFVRLTDFNVAKMMEVITQSVITQSSRSAITRSRDHAINHPSTPHRPAPRRTQRRWIRCKPAIPPPPEPAPHTYHLPLTLPFTTHPFRSPIHSHLASPLHRSGEPSR